VTALRHRFQRLLSSSSLESFLSRRSEIYVFDIRPTRIQKENVEKRLYVSKEEEKQKVISRPQASSSSSSSFSLS